MKKYLVLALFMATVLSLNANIDPKTTKSQCRIDSAEMNRCENLQLRIKSDLLSGSWTEQVVTHITEATVEHIFQFQSLGLVDIITNFANGRSEVSKKIWRVEEVNNQAFLILTNIGSDDSTTYQLQQTCHGMVLKDELFDKEIKWTAQK